MTSKPYGSPKARERLHFVVCDDGAWLHLISSKPQNWFLFDYNETQDTIKAQLLFSFGLKNTACNAVSAFLESEYGVQCAFANLFIKLSKKIKGHAEAFYPDNMYIIRIPPSSVWALPESAAKLWPEAKTYLSVCASVNELLETTRTFEATALPFLSELFPEC
jgi:hypothetical protein